jgi:WD40 repeat protein
MSAIFISHSSRDAAVAAEMRSWLQRIGHRSLFLDFDPEDGIPAGRDWEHELYHQLRICRAVIVICSGHSMASRWCFAEITQARAMGKVLLPVRIDSCTIDPIVVDHQCIDLTAGEGAAYERLASGLRAAGLDPADAFDWDGSRAPYPGLLSFQERDAAVFFGRDEEIGAGLDLLNKVRRLGTAGFVMVLGASGSGKSSLVRAGLVPRLRRDTDRWLIVDPFRPGDDPVQTMAGAIARAFVRVGGTRERVEVREGICRALDSGEPGSAHPLVETARELRYLADRPEATTLLIVDQFEELLARPGDPASSGLLGLLRSAAEPDDSPVVVIATMRSDFLAAFQNAPSLTDVRYESLSVGPLSPEDISRVIERPARMADIDVDPALVQAMVADSEGGDALPLLAFTLRELHEHTPAGGRMDLGTYRARLGGLHGALARVADELVEAEELEPEQQDQLRLALLAMVRLTDDDRWVRRACAWDEIPESIHPVLERFVNARLLISGGDGEARTVEVCHEALFRSWGRLVAWLDQSIESLRLRRDLHQAARTWEAGGRDAGDLWRGIRLGRASELIRRGDVPVEDVDREFVGASEDAERAQVRHEELRRRRTVRAGVAVAVGAPLLALVVVLLVARARSASERADEQDRQIVAISTSASARALLESNPALALAVAAESAEITDSPPPQATDALVRARVAFARRRAQPRGEPLDANDGDVVWVALSPDGKRLASIAGDGYDTVHLWDTTTGEAIGNALVHQGAVGFVAFSRDGEHLTTGSEDGRVHRWDAATGEPEGEVLPFHDGERPLLYSPDGTRLVLVDRSGAVWLGDSTTGERFGEPLDVQPDVIDMTFSRDGSRLVVVNDDEMVRSWSWDPTTGQPLAAHVFDQADQEWVGFGPDGTQLAFLANDGSLLLRDAASGDPVDEVLTHDPIDLTWVEFSPDGQWMAARSRDRRSEVHLWDRASGEFGPPLAGHTSEVLAVTFSADSTSLATASADATARVWELSSDEPAEDVLTDETDTLYGLAFSPDGSLLASGSIDGTVQLWDPASRKPVATLTGESEEHVAAVAFSPDGDLLAVARPDGTVQLWDPASRERVENLTGESDDSVSAVAFSPDGELLAVGSSNGTVQLWDPVRREPVGKPLTHHNHELFGLGVAFSPDGTLLASAGDDETVLLFDPATGDRVGKPFVGHDGTVMGVAFSPDGTLLASAGDDGTVRLWDPTTGDPIAAPMTGHQSSVVAVTFSLDGRILASAGVDGTVRLWDPATGSPIGEDPREGSSVFAVAFSPDSTLIASASAGDLRLSRTLWDVDDACELAAPYVTANQVQAYLPPDRQPHACALRA